MKVAPGFFEETIPQTSVNNVFLLAQMSCSAPLGEWESEQSQVRSMQRRGVERLRERETGRKFSHSVRALGCEA